MEEVKIPTPEPEGPSSAEPAAVTPEATEATEPKRGRGRPRKDSIPEADVLPRKPKGVDKSAGKPSDAPAKNGEFYARMVEGSHLTISLLTGMDLTLPAKDAAALGEAIYQVVKEYDLSFISKYAPILNLVAVTASVEIPVMMRAQMGLAQKKAVQTETKQQIKPQGPGVEMGQPLKIVPNGMGGGTELGQSRII